MKVKLSRKKELTLKNFINSNLTQAEVYHSKLLKSKVEDDAIALYEVCGHCNSLKLLIYPKKRVILAEDKQWEIYAKEFTDYVSQEKDSLVEQVKLEYRKAYQKYLEKDFLKFMSNEKFRNIYDKARASPGKIKILERYILKGSKNALIPYPCTTEQIINRYKNKELSDYLFNPQKWISNKIEEYIFGEEDIIHYMKVKADNAIYDMLMKKPTKEMTLYRNINTALNISAKIIKVKLKNGRVVQCKNLILDCSYLEGCDGCEQIELKDIKEITYNQKNIYEAAI